MFKEYLCYENIIICGDTPGLTEQRIPLVHRICTGSAPPAGGLGSEESGGLREAAVVFLVFNC
jgi:hypothetical protein